jgi:DNA invertase Pin-like site-specific DNA recombinase
MQASEGVSLDAQRERIAHYCSANGYRLIDIISDEISGKSLERPGLQKALGMLESGKAGALVVVKLDRLTRSILDLGSLLHRYFACEEQGRMKYRLLSVTESLDTTNPMGRFVVYILGLIAQWEREAISERTRDALQHLKAQGVKMGRAPYGYRYSANADASGRRTVEPVPEQQEVIRRIIKMREAGTLQQAICAALNEEGLPSPFGQRWQRLMIHRVLKAANMTTPRIQPATRRPPRVIRRDKAQAAERARELRADGLSLRAIGERLLEEGVYPVRGNVWHASQIMDFVQVPDPSGAGPLAAKLRADGLALGEIGRRLNYQGYMSPSGGLWDRKTLSDLISRHAGEVGATARANF